MKNSDTFPTLTKTFNHLFLTPPAAILYTNMSPVLLHTANYSVDRLP